MGDMYRDTHDRYQNDPAFRAVVKALEAHAREHGFTPGELKQIAFRAALNIEETRPLPTRFLGEVAGTLNDGTPVFYGRAP